MRKKQVVILSLLLFALLATAGTALARPLNFRAHMTEAPGIPIESRGQGQFHMQLTEDGELSFTMAVSRLEGETLAAHIHYSQVPAGNGPPVISLCGGFGPPPIPVAQCGGPGNPARGTLSLSAAQMATLLTAVAENRAYVNVHTTAHPPGEIRGALTLNN